MDDLTKLADELQALSSAYFAVSRETVSAGLCRLDDLPDEGFDLREAREAIAEFGRRLWAKDPGLMMRVYDRTVDRHGYEGVHGVNHAWTGIGGWAA